MSQKNKEVSWLKKWNTIAVVIVFIAFLYVWKMESTPKPPLDRTVTSTGKTSTTPTIVPTSPKPIPVPVTLKPEPVKSILTPSVTETTLTGSEMNPLEDTGSISNVPPSTIIETTPVAETPGIPTGSGTTQSWGITYYNSYLDYGLSLPRGSYYAGYGGRDGAAHTMGFASGTGVTSFDEAPVKLWYFPHKLLPELGNEENSFYQDPSTNMTYLKLGNGTIKIQGNMEDPILLKIVETVNRGD